MCVRRSKDLNLDAMLGSATRMLPIQRSLVSLATTCPGSILQLAGVQHHTEAGKHTLTRSAAASGGGVLRRSGAGNAAVCEGQAEPSSEEVRVLQTDRVSHSAAMGMQTKETPGLMCAEGTAQTFAVMEQPI